MSHDPDATQPYLPPVMRKPEVGCPHDPACPDCGPAFDFEDAEIAAAFDRLFHNGAAPPCLVCGAPEDGHDPGCTVVDDEAEMVHERAHAGVSDPDECDRGPACPGAGRCGNCGEPGAAGAAGLCAVCHGIADLIEELEAM